MPEPSIHFFVSGEEKEVSTDSSLWKLLLLGDDHPDVGKTPASGHKDITIGDYLSSAKQFIIENDFYFLKKGVSRLTNNPSDADRITRVDLFLEKHGAFYHPIRVQVELPQERILAFVLNGAVSQKGLALIQKEFDLISDLNRRNDAFLPQVFGCGSVHTSKGEIAFFLGEWLQGYQEFHLTRHHNENEIVIWGSQGALTYVEEERFFPVYGQMATMLTTLYDSDTFQQVFPFHHAAGDFIIKKENGGWGVKLITVRGYENLTDFTPHDQAFVLPGLLFFFLNLTLRMRLDRLDGTGAPAMVNDKVIPFISEGFLKGLKPEISAAFPAFLAQFSLNQVLEIMEIILESCPPAPSEVELVKNNFESHYKKVISFFKTI